MNSYQLEPIAKLVRMAWFLKSTVHWQLPSICSSTDELVAHIVECMKLCGFGMLPHLLLANRAKQYSELQLYKWPL